MKQRKNNYVELWLSEVISEKTGIEHAPIDILFMLCRCIYCIFGNKKLNSFIDMPLWIWKLTIVIFYFVYSVFCFCFFYLLCYLFFLVRVKAELLLHFMDFFKLMTKHIWVSHVPLCVFQNALVLRTLEWGHHWHQLCFLVWSPLFTNTPLNKLLCLYFDFLHCLK